MPFEGNRAGFLSCSLLSMKTRSLRDKVVHAWIHRLLQTLGINEFHVCKLSMAKYGCKNSKCLCKKIYQKREKKCMQKIFDVVRGGYVIRLWIVATKNKMRSIQDNLVMD